MKPEKTLGKQKENLWNPLNSIKKHSETIRKHFKENLEKNFLKKNLEYEL